LGFEERLFLEAVDTRLSLEDDEASIRGREGDHQVDEGVGEILGVVEFGFFVAATLVGVSVSLRLQADQLFSQCFLGTQHFAVVRQAGQEWGEVFGR